MGDAVGTLKKRALRTEAVGAPAVERAPPKARMRHRPELDALRFLAFLCVLFDHLPIRSDSRFRIVADLGSFGLCLFFVLSAYLIVSLLMREKTATGTVSVRAFMLRRVLRIWPLYFAAIAINGIVGLFYSPARISAYGTASMLLLATNLYILKSGWLLGCIAPLWSISIEEQFYLIVPCVGRLLSRRMIWAFFGAVLFISYSALWRLGQRHAGNLEAVWPNSLVQFQFFALGALIALWAPVLSRSLIVRAFVFSCGVGLWWLAQSHYRVHSWESSVSGVSLCAGYGCLLLGTAAIFIAFLGAEARFPKPVLYLGVISYGLYVYHQFWIVLVFSVLKISGFHNLAPLLVSLIATIATAALSYRFFESPILKLKNRCEIIRTDAA